MPKQTKTYPTLFDPQEVLSLLSLEEGMHIADFGTGVTGSGNLIFKAAALVGSTKGGVVYALDVQKNIIEHLKSEIHARAITNLIPVWTDLEMLGKNSLKDHSIDIVFMVNMLFQSTKRAAVFEEAKRVLKPGGQIVVIDWIKQGTPLGPPADERVDLEKLKQIAYDTGFNKIKEFSPDPYHFGIIFKK